jgi:hypothetical protein
VSALIAAAVVLLVGGLATATTVRLTKKAKAAKEAPKRGVTIIQLRGRTPIGKIVRGCVFQNGQYVLDKDSRNPQTVIYDGQYVRNDPDGEPFLFYDTQSQCVVGYTGECDNDDDVTVVHHDETVEDMPAHEAAKLREGPSTEPHTVYRKLPQLWRRLGGARLWAEKNTDDWLNIQQNMPGLLAILHKYAPYLLILVFVMLIVVAVGVFVG